MPKETAYKLKDDKRKPIINAFLVEFSINTYDDATFYPVIKKQKLLWEECLQGTI